MPERGGGGVLVKWINLQFCRIKKFFGDGWG